MTSYSMTHTLSIITIRDEQIRAGRTEPDQSRWNMIFGQSWNYNLLGTLDDCLETVWLNDNA